MIDSFKQLNNTINEKHEEFTRKKLNKFILLLTETKKSKEVAFYSSL